MKEPVWVLHEVVIAVHQSLLAEHGGAPGIRDESLLESALSRPRQRFEYSDEPSIFDLAASYCYGLANNHPFVDGNKRIALTIAALFLELNGYSLTAPEPNAVVIIEELAAGNLSEDDLSSWFGECSISNA
ncbi:MAG: type II toxin-antitoxin system death-on-curing family toxin [Candidatus Thiodiazotropha endolucinida]|nr:type II toxin-antitoxin system death-on-curing family toxin [Candidatus Thiodiazotropha taylori]MCW4225243.1 type II toxin-antitoxin system death-on-curing family toxin [Candidatus Thiodiazotropha endolucinida]MCG7883249.1 type II toxin-antitoxin system death-on-curing family toxin [Candidatus Thiodiazotropha taylori]MCG7886814.1 type II toxin-antitoxin system death-on-curing family toxin [Candidatus Thiodiazotropha taylori]MCG7892218.1 type II toxin-antitoxin system death-on-curing family t